MKRMRVCFEMGPASPARAWTIAYLVLTVPRRGVWSSGPSERLHDLVSAAISALVIDRTSRLAEALGVEVLGSAVERVGGVVDDGVVG